MRDTLTFFAAMFAMTALAEFAVLRRWREHRGYSFCVLSVALLSGVVWLASAVALFHIRWGWKAAQEPAISGSQWVTVVLLVLLDVVVFGAVAILPAGGAALIYRRWRQQE